MGHHHDHARRHKGGPAPTGRLSAVLAITVAIFAAELLGALISGSVALLADAGHVLADAAGIGLSLGAMLMSRRPPTSARTFGYARTEILAATVNAVVLGGISVFVMGEALHRLVNPPVVNSGAMAAFGLFALLGNGFSLLLLLKVQQDSLNLHGAFLEVLGDLLGAVAVLVAAGVVAVSGFRRADAIAGLLIGLVILPRTWKLLRTAVDVLLEATPRDVNLDEVRSHIMELESVLDCHDLHAWTITSGMNVLSVHVVVVDGADGGHILAELGECLADHFDIEHSTFQLEPAGHREHEVMICT